jgi:hypothetical protein
MKLSIDNQGETAMKNRLLLTLLLSYAMVSPVYAFGPNVLLNQTTTASSSPSTAKNITDGNRATHWAGTSSPSVTTTPLLQTKYVTVGVLKMKKDLQVQAAWQEFKVDVCNAANICQPMAVRAIRSFHSTGTDTGYLNYFYYYGNAFEVRKVIVTFYRGAKMINNQWVNFTAGDIAELEMYER